MKRSVKATMVAIALVPVLTVAACSSDSKSSSTTTAAPTTVAPTTTAAPTTTVAAGAATSEWAISATATTSYGTGTANWSPSKATGAPNVTVCADNGEAWAPEGRTTTDTLTTKFATAVTPTKIEVVETFNPEAVTKVVVSGSGQSATVYTGTAKKVTECPYTLSIPVSNVTFKVDTVAVTIDQSVIGNWTEIDAVRLTGTP